jgi:hypothetical protein
MITCKDAHRLLLQRQDRPLGWRQRLELVFHLAICIACRRFSKQVDFLRQAMRRFGGLD